MLSQNARKGICWGRVWHSDGNGSCHIGPAAGESESGKTSASSKTFCEDEVLCEEFVKPLEETAYEQNYLDCLLSDDEPLEKELVKTLTVEEEFTEWFAPFFFKASGSDEKVDAYDLQQVMADVFQEHFSKAEEFSLEACRSMVSMMDFDRSGNLSYGQFKKLWPKIMQWKECFTRFDGDVSVTIDRQELNSAMQALNFDLNDQSLDMLIARYVNKSKSINLDCFFQICTRVTALAEDYHLFKEEHISLNELLLTSLYN